MDINDGLVPSHRWPRTQGLTADYRRFITDVEQLLKNGSHLSGESLAAVGRALEDKIAQARARLVDTGPTTADKIGHACDLARAAVQQHPLLAVGTTALVAAAIGCAAALLLLRR